MSRCSPKRRAWAKHREAMRANIAADLQIDVGRVNIKATTTEGLGFIGRGEGIACQAVVLIETASGRRH